MEQYKDYIVDLPEKSDAEKQAEAARDNEEAIHIAEAFILPTTTTGKKQRK